MDRFIFSFINRALACIGGGVGMKVTMNTFCAIVKLATGGETFFRKQAAAIGVDQYMINRLVRSGFIEKTDGICEWRITDKAYRHMTEMQKLLEQVQ